MTMSEVGLLQNSRKYICFSVCTFVACWTLTWAPWENSCCSVVSGALCDPHGLQHTMLPCHSLFPRVCSDSCPLIQWCHPTISSSAALFSFCPQSWPASGYFPMSWLFTSNGPRTGVSASASASALPMTIQGWFPLGCTGLISLQSKGLSRIFSNTTIQKHQFFGAQLSL